MQIPAMIARARAGMVANAITTFFIVPPLSFPQFAGIFKALGKTTKRSEKMKHHSDRHRNTKNGGKEEECKDFLFSFSLQWVKHFFFLMT